MVVGGGLAGLHGDGQVTGNRFLGVVGGDLASLHADGQVAVSLVCSVGTSEIIPAALGTSS